MGTKKDDWCLKKAFDDERLFILMTRDATAASVVGEWIKQNIGRQPRERLIEALDAAIEMHSRFGEMYDRKEGIVDKCNLCGMVSKTAMLPECANFQCPKRAKK